jgi:hypothetical protein
MVVLEAEAELLDVVGTLRPPGRLAGRLNGREEKADKGPDDGDDNEQFDEREGPGSTENGGGHGGGSWKRDRMKNGRNGSNGIRHRPEE